MYPELAHSDHDRAEPVFSETQRFTQGWVWLIVIGAAAIMWWFAIEHMMSGQLGQSLRMDVFLGVFLLLFGIGLPWMFAVAKLTTQVRPDGVYVRFVPFHLRWRHFGWEQIAELRGRRYRPLLEYGGWGVRFGAGGWAYNVKGNQGVQLTLHGKAGVLIGTQRLDDFVDAVKRSQTP